MPSPATAVARAQSRANRTARKVLPILAVVVGGAMLAAAMIDTAAATPARAHPAQVPYHRPHRDSGDLAEGGAAIGKLYGDPLAAASYWRGQGYYDDCAEMAAADVVGLVTGHEPTERDIVTVAENTPSTAHRGPIYYPRYSHGTNNLDVGVLLERYGVHSITGDSQAGGIGASDSTDVLKHSLAHGQQVIAGVNANILWNKSTGDRTTENHFVVVTGIDTNTGIVHLNDSGTPNGQDERVSIVVFAAAWATSHHERTITDPLDPQVDMRNGWAGRYSRSGLQKR